MFLKSLRYGLAAILAVFVVILITPGAGLTASLMSNPGLNSPDSYVDIGRDWREYDEKVAQGWSPFFVPGSTFDGDGDAEKLHWMSSRQFAQAFGGADYYREGDASQVLWSSYQMDAGVYQQVSGLTVGQDYAFEVAMASFWRGSGYPVTDGKMTKCVGTDPSGGTDPTAASVIWDWDNCDSSDKTWPYLDIAATAGSSTMTFFARIQAPENESYNHVDLNYVFIDDGRMALAPTVELTITDSSASQAGLEWAAMVHEVGWQLKGVEVQYRDTSQSEWQVIQGKDGLDSSYSLTIQAGHRYTVRARAWQKTESDGATYDLPGTWEEVSLGSSNQDLGFSLFIPLLSKGATLVTDPIPTPPVDPPPGPDPTPDPSGNDFQLNTVLLLPIDQNGGCMGNHNVFMSVLDHDGEPLWGAVVGDPPENNFRVTTGDKNEPFFDYGTKMAEIDLYNSGTELQVIEYPDGSPVSSDLTPQLSTNTWEIPVEWLIEAGYCQDAEHCSELGLICQGHYSYWVVWQKMEP